MATAKKIAAVDYPVPTYGVTAEKTLRHFDCISYSECLGIVSNTKKATGFRCEECPGYQTGNGAVETSSATIFPLRKPYEVREVPVDQIFLNVTLEEAMYKSISASLKTIKEIFQPPILLENGRDQYLCYAGRRRVFAAKSEGLQSIECKVFPKGTPEKVMRLYEFAENMVRKTNPGSEAESLAYLIYTNKWTDRETSEKLGVPMSQIRARLKLLKLIPGYFKMLKEGKITLEAANKLCNLPEEKQNDLFANGETSLKKIKETSRSVKLDSLLEKDELFALPSNRKDRLDEVKDRLQAVINTTKGDTGLLNQALTLIETFQSGSAS